jgi:hypothetical protein
VKATCRYQDTEDILEIRIENLPEFDSMKGDDDILDDWGCITAFLDDEGRPRIYRVIRLGDLYPHGQLKMPPGFEEPSHRFEINEVPGRSFTLQELIAWIHDRVTVSA